MASTAAVLSLQTISKFPTVEIDGRLYPLLPKDALPLFDVMKLETRLERWAELWKGADQTDRDKQETTDILRDIVLQILKAPPEIHTKLTDTHRMLIVNAFTQLPQSTRLNAEARTGLKASRTSSNGAKPSRGSNGSTAAQSRAGGAKSRSGS